MFLVGELGATITADDKPFNRTMDSVNRKGRQTSGELTSLFKTAGAAIGASLLAAGAMAVKQAAEIESLRIQVDTLVGSAKEGERIFKRLQDYSAGTPFQLNDLIKANNILMGMGQNSEFAYENIQILGDIASATGANINELAVTFGQASAEGKLMTRDIREFINRGVPLTKLLADSMGVAKNEIFDLASESKITFDVLVKALQDATTGTGLYAGATEKAADSIKGSSSTMRDNISILAGSVGDLIVESTDLNTIMKDASGEIKRLTGSIEGANVPTSDLANEFRGLYVILREMPNTIQSVTDKLGGYIKVAQFIKENSPIGTLEEISNWLRETLRDIGEADRFFKEAGKGLQLMLDADTSKLANIDKGLNDIIDKTKENSKAGKELSFTNKEVSDSYNKLKPAIENMPTVDEIFDPSIVEQFNMSLEQIVSNFEGIGDFSGRIFEPGSIGAMRDEIQKLEEQLIQTTDPVKARRLQEEIDILNLSIQQMRYRTEDANVAAKFFSNTFADGLEDVLFRAKSVSDAIKDIVRQLASRAIATGLMGLFTGGFGGGGFLKAMFGGARAMGGPVNTGKAYLVGEQGPELFMPNTGGSIVPNKVIGGGTQVIEVRINGTLTGRGTDLAAVIDETVRQQGRLT